MVEGLVDRDWPVPQFHGKVSRSYLHVLRKKKKHVHYLITVLRFCFSSLVAFQETTRPAGTRVRCVFVVEPADESDHVQPFQGANTFHVAVV